MCKACCKGGCVLHWIVKILVVVGGINWGLVGLGMLLGGKDFNVVKMLLGSMPSIEAVVYLLVGVAAIMKLFTCKCSKCNKCDVPAEGATTTPQA